MFRRYFIAHQSPLCHRPSSSNKAATPSSDGVVVVGGGGHRCRTNVIYLCVAGCFLFQFLWTTKHVTLRIKYQMIMGVIQNAKHNEYNDNDVPNTNWNNVQYVTGEFGKKLSSEEELIRQKCDELASVFTGDHHICAGPIKDYFTCCYCTFSHKHEPFSVIDNRDSWACAIPRNNSLLMNSTNHTITTTTISKRGPKIAWVTGKFGHGNRFETEVNEYCQQVKEMNLLHPQDIFCYWDSPEYVVRNKRFVRHLKFRTDPDDTSAKGGGYWLHKSVLLRHYMDLYQDGDFIVWTDVDRIDFFQLGTFHTVMETMVRRNDDFLVEVMCHVREAAYTKEDMLAAFENATNATTTDFLRGPPQVNSNMIVVRNSPAMKRFMDAWVECVADWHMVSDEPSVLPNAPEFYDHRHDQSILSLLMKSFLSSQSVVGPPARAYQPGADILTYKLRSGVDPVCPFHSFYAAMYAKSLHNLTIS